MHRVTPEAYIVAVTEIDLSVVEILLEEIGVKDSHSWLALRGGIDSLTLLTEIAGRLCYNSFEAGLNPNVRTIRGDTEAYIGNLIDQGHGSVFEHASITFVFRNVSRVFTHELVRHRVGTAISQESMRYVRLVDIPIWFPDSFHEIHDRREFEDDIYQVVYLMENLQAKWARRFDLDTTKDFAIKKHWTSLLRRYFSPTGVATSIQWTCNVRELRHVIQLRTSEGAEEEMRKIFGEVAALCAKRWPTLFGDISRQEDGSWKAT